MKKAVALVLIALLILSLAACGSSSGNGEAATDGTENAASENGNNESPAGENEVVIGKNKVKLTYESHHRELYFKENAAEIEKASYDQVCNLYYRKNGENVFVINLVYFRGKSVDEVMIGSDYSLTSKMVNGLEYQYFEYEDNGAPGHTYIYHFNGTTYTISFVSNFDMTSLESVFLNNVHFEKE